MCVGKEKKERNDVNTEKILEQNEHKQFNKPEEKNKSIIVIGGLNENKCYKEIESEKGKKLKNFDVKTDFKQFDQLQIDPLRILNRITWLS